MRSLPGALAHAGLSALALTKPQAPAKSPCAEAGDMAAWKVGNGGQTEGFAAAWVPKHTQTAVPGFVCLDGCTRQSVLPKAPLQTPAAAQEAHASISGDRVEFDLPALTALMALDPGDEPSISDACFIEMLQTAFAQDDDLPGLTDAAAVQPSAAAAFLQQLYAHVRGVLQHAAARFTKANKIEAA